jgi:hypothetical protein
LAPSGLAVTGATSSQVSLNWVDNSGNETGFELERATGDLPVSSGSADVADYSGQANHGTLQPSAASGPTFTTTGGHSHYQFDGVDDRVRVPDSASTDIGTGNATLSAWVNFSQLPLQSSGGAPMGAIAGKGFLATTVGHGLFTYNQQIVYQVRSGSTTINAFSDGNLMDGNWHHIVGVLDRSSATGIRLYVDGTAQSSTGSGATFASVNLDNNAAFAVGARENAGAFQWPFRGGVDEVRLYKGRALSGVEIASLFAAGRGAHTTSIEATGQNLYFPVAPSTATWTQIATAAANAQSANDNTVSAATPYHYRIRAVGSAGNSGYSSTASTITPASGELPPDAPSSLAVTGATSSQVSLSWVDNATNETGFELERATGDLPVSSGSADVADYSGQANHGTLQPSAASGPTFTTAGGHSHYHFDGVDDRVRVPDSASTDIGTGNATLSAWVNFSQLPLQSSGGVALGAIAGKGFLAVTSGHGLFAYNQQIVYQVRSGSTTINVFSDGNLMDGNWHHIVGVLDRSSATGIRLYVDGTAQSSPGNGTSFTGVNLDNTAAFAVGSRENSGAFQWPFRGGVDQVRLYKGRALSGVEIASLFAAGRGAHTTSIEATGQNLYFPVAPSTATWTQIAAPAADEQSADDNTVSAATPYHYRIRAVGSAGNSGYSSTASTITPASGELPPTAPSGLAVTGATSSQVSLSWVDNSGNETGFELERATGDLPVSSGSADVADYSGQANHGTLQPSAASGPTFTTAGGHSHYQFDGVDDRVRVPDSASTDIGTGNATLSAWVNFTQLPLQSSGGVALGAIAGKGFLAVTTGHGLFAYNQQIVYQVRSGGTTINAFSDGNLMDGNWHHIVGVLDRSSATGIRLYVDGIAQSSPGNGTSFTGVNLDNTAAFAVGSRENSGAFQWPFRGGVDEVRLYKGRVLSALEIQALFATGRGVDIAKIPTDGLNLYVPFAPGSAEWSAVATPAAGANSHTDTTVSIYTPYHYRIRATNAAGNSAWSNTVSTRTTILGTQGTVVDSAPVVHPVIIDTPEADGSANSAALRLEITQAPAPVDGTGLGVQAFETGPGLILRWNSREGAIYAIEYAPTLDSIFDVVHEGLPATPPLNTFRLPDGGQQGFYRIRER